MKKALLILGSETSEFATGKFNRGLFETAAEVLAQEYEITTTVIEDGYDVEEEIAKWEAADHIFYQYPVYWFSVPSSMKKYMDSVYAYDKFFTFTDGEYGSGGLFTDKTIMLSTTWNAPADAFDSGSKFLTDISLNDALMPMQKVHEYCGMKVLPHFSSHNVVVGPDFENDKARLIDHLTQVHDLKKAA